jgi:DNA-binding CsgD family transcriptional regulator
MTGGELLPAALRVVPPFGFVGRSDELERLHRLWASVPGGRQVALVGGEPGAGKSRLVRELAHRVHDEGGQVLHGVCDPTASVPYQPVVEALGHLVRSVDDAELADLLGPAGGELVRLFPELPRRVEGLVSPAAAGPETERHRLHLALVDLLADVSARRPVLLVLDDLHWADRSTLVLLRLLLRARGEARVMVAATFRDGAHDVDQPLSDLLAHLARTDGVLRIRLTGLGDAELADFVDRAGGALSDDDRATLVRALAGLSGGNPFLVGEVWRQLVDSGVLVDRDGRRGLAGPVDALPTPHGVRQVTESRLALLPEPTRTVLEVAATVGPRVGMGVLRGATGLDEVALLEAVDGALRAGVLDVDPGPPPGYRFSHELVRRAVQDGLSPLARARRHLQVATALERVPGEGAGALADLARHWTEASVIAEEHLPTAASYSVRAAEAARHQLAFDESARLLQHALRLGVPDHDRTSLLLRLGAVQRAAGSWAAAVRTYQEAARRAATDRDGPRLAEAAVGLEETCWRPGITDAGAVERLHEALALVEATGGGSDHLRVRLLSGLVRAQGYAGRWDEAAAAHVRSVALARRTGAPRDLALALGQSYWGRGPTPPEQVAAALKEAAGHAREVGDVELACYVRAFRLTVLAETGRVDARVRAEMREFGAVAEALGQSIFLYHHAQSRASMGLAEGRLAEAEQAARRALELSRTEGFEAGGAHGIQMFGIRREQDRLREVAAAVRLLAASASAAPWRPGLAVVCAELGFDDQAREQLQLACADDLVTERDGALRMASLVYLAEACYLLGETEHAPRLRERLAVWQGRPVVVAGMVACLGAADRYLGLLACCTGDLDAAERHLGDAVALNERLGQVMWSARSRFELAGVLLRRQQPGDRDRARALLEVVERTAGSLALPALLRQVAEVRADMDAGPERDGLAADAGRVPGAGTAAPPAPDGLTAREVEVLHLLAEGRSNREIGSRLFISQNTAANHVRSILLKTGCANRTEAAAYAHRHGLVGVVPGGR